MPRVWAEIDVAAFRRNVARVRRAAQADVLAVIKADAYGHGALLLAAAAVEAGAALLGVGDVREARHLRRAGLTAPIVVLGAPAADEYDEALQLELSLCVHDVETLFALDARAHRAGRHAHVHLKLDTGLGRLGVLPWEWRALFAVARDARHLAVEGLATHFAAADAGQDALRDAQLARFRQGLALAARVGLAPRWVHAANSAALASCPEARFNLVRPGFALYGLGAGGSDERDHGEPVLSLHAEVVHLKRVPAGTPLGYGHCFVTARPSVIAVLPVGYADGYRRALSNRAAALLGGRRVPVVGRVSMDYTLVDATDVPGVRLGDRATLIGRQGAAQVSAAELAGLLDTIPYEITCALGRRVRRVAVGEEATPSARRRRSA